MNDDCGTGSASIAGENNEPVKKKLSDRGVFIISEMLVIIFFLFGFDFFFLLFCSFAIFFATLIVFAIHSVVCGGDLQ